ncbi:hypothetical protein [Streptomyces sp. V3I7]|uniref:hypothetical protein n=1 Tax=Streptomyces sp. V3I7 TaxID=3042278 RepID=UPI00277E24D3|nr:hypothetical protein [Streptomyces sp. V3I7]MDQ0992662.1 hypothetical protein [Streptomyces sp. V3I7]
MGERHSVDGGLSGRRRVHPGGAVSGAGRGREGGDDGLEVWLAAEIRQDDVDPEGERRAVAAFRAAREAGAHGAARSRRRDDWRPREARRAKLSAKAALSVLFASLTLGGVAVAAIGSGGSSSGDTGDVVHSAQPSTSGPGQADVAQESAAGQAGGTEHPAHPERPGTAKDTLAHCRAYEHLKGRGKAMSATAWQRLVSAAGGEDRVAAYCAAQLRQAADGNTEKGGTPAASKGPSASGSSGRSGESGGTGGGNTGNTGNTGNVGKKTETGPKANAVR